MNLEIKSISKRFGKKSVLKDISFSAKSGECIGILGGNGSGKSTLLSILAGVSFADGGEFLYNEKNLFEYATQRSELIGYVPQGTPLFDELSAYDNLLLWYDKKTLKSELENGFLATLGINDFLKKRVSKMSGGMKKRLSIACAIAKNPPVILLDEPMSALDLVCKQTLIDYMSMHKRRGGILILVTHDSLELGLCDKCYIIKDGKNIPFNYDGNIKKLVNNL